MLGIVGIRPTCHLATALTLPSDVPSATRKTLAALWLETARISVASKEAEEAAGRDQKNHGRIFENF